MAMAAAVENQVADDDWLVCADCGAIGDGAVGAAGLHRLAAVVCRGTLVLAVNGTDSEAFKTKIKNQRAGTCLWCRLSFSIETCQNEEFPTHRP